MADGFKPKPLIDAALVTEFGGIEDMEEFKTEGPAHHDYTYVPGFSVNLTATNASSNKEVQKQALMGLIQLKAQNGPWYMQLMQAAVQMWGTPIGQVALDNLQGMAYLEKRLMEQFDMRNLNELVPQIPKDPVQAISDPVAALQLLPPGGGGAQGAPGAPPMEGPPAPAGEGSPVGV